MVSAKDVIVIMWNHGEEKISEKMPKEPVVVHKKDQQILSYVSVMADKEKLLGRVVKYCEPAGLNYENNPQYSPSGAFVLKGIPVDSKFDYSWEEKPLWKGYHPLIICKALSKLINPTTVSLEYAARCFFLRTQN